MTKGEFTKRVLLIMNEIGMTDPQGNSFIGADTVQIDRHIEGTFVDAWRRIAKEAPRTWLKSKSFMNSPHTSQPQNGTGYVELPSDFYLLSSFKMLGWEKPIYEAALENERTSAIQTNEWTRGSQLRPVGTIANKQIGDEIKQILKYYSLSRCSSDTTYTIEEAIYIPVVEELSDKESTYDLGISDQVIIPLVYLSAATVFTIFDKPQVAAGLEARAAAMLPGLASIKANNLTTKL